MRGVVDGDAVCAVAVTILQREAIPRSRNAWIYLQRLTPFREAEYSFEPDTVEPACGAGVPRPPAASQMTIRGIHVSRYHIRLDLVRRHVLGRERMCYRIDHLI